MKVIVILMAALTIGIPLFSQTTISYHPELYEVGVVFTSRTVNDATFDPGEPGPGMWDFTPFTTGDENNFTSVEYSPTIPHISECAVTPNYILYYHTTTDTSETEGWGFSYVEPSHIDPLGLYGNYEGSLSIEMWAFNSSYTPSNSFPVNYTDSWTTITEGDGAFQSGMITVDYDYQDTMYNYVDGYGEVILPCGRFDALRIKRRHTRHSHSDHPLFGFDKTEREFSYAWITTELGIAATFTGPKDTTGGMPDSNFTTGTLAFQIYNTALGIEENILPTLLVVKVYPNPFNSSVTISAGVSQANVEIFDILGNRVWSKIVPRSGPAKLVWQPDENISSGVYLVKATAGGLTASRKIVYLK